MSDRYLIGVDMGTQGTKTTLFDLDGCEIAESFEQSRLVSPAPGVVEQDPEEIFSSVCHTIKQVVEKSGVAPQSISAVGLDGQMAGILGIDEKWNAITHYDSWLDTRCEKYIKIIKKEAEDLVVRTTGCPVTYAHGPKILWWKHERPEVYKKISKFVLPTTYVAGRMTGLKASQAYIDYTQLHFSGFGDVLHGRWSDELLELFDVLRDKMPDIIEPWKIVGYVTKEVAFECGLKDGIPVAAGCGDQAAASLGAGVTQKGIALDVAGTASVFSCCVDAYKPDVEHKTLLFPRSVIPGLWLPLAYINGGGLCIRWFRDNLTGKGGTAGYEELDDEAAMIPCGSEGLLFLPHFGGRVCPNNPDVRGSYLGLNWAHTRAHLYRAIMEGIAYEYDSYFNILKELLGKLSFSHVLAIGGGAKSDLFNSIKADVLGIPYSTLTKGDTATLGSAVVAGYGVGIYDDLVSTVEKRMKLQSTVPYRAENHRKYEKYAAIYRGLFGALGDTFKELNEDESPH
ncbi:MAG: xylulokinase [Desulfitobacteriaceae bacterium]